MYAAPVPRQAEGPSLSLIPFISFAVASALVECVPTETSCTTDRERRCGKSVIQWTVERKTFRARSVLIGQFHHMW